MDAMITGLEKALVGFTYVPPRLSVALAHSEP